MTLSIHRRATLWTDRTAVVDDGDTEHSYAALDERVEQTARRLVARGVGEDDAVAVCSRNRLEHLALLFACRRLGATLAPISHRLEREAVASLGDRIDPGLVLHEERFADLADAVATGGGNGAAQTTVASFRETEPAPATALPAKRGGAGADAIDESALLYLHTGGTTGVPKVVVVSHRQVEWNCVTEAAAWGLGEDDVAPILLPLYHTGGWLLLTLPLLYVGGRIVLHREFDPGRALAAIEDHGATHVFAVAAIFAAMAEHDAFEEADFESVKWFMSGGGPTPEAVIDAYRDRGATFVQGYGLTEGGPNDLYFPPDRADEAKATESVGRPFPDVEARLVDPESGDRLGVAVGGDGSDGDGTGGDGGPDREGAVTGELELRGPVAARRYLDTEDGTFDRAWVSTGDLARRDADGDYAIVGRTDNMFVSGGENVYPEAIEATLERHPAVASVGVVGVPHDRWGTVPKAVVVPAGGDEWRGDGEAEEDTDLDPDDLEAFCRGRLADFERPRAWAFVDELPRSGPGKLDREALAAEYGGEQTSENGHDRGESSDGPGGDSA